MIVKKFYTKYTHDNRWAYDCVGVHRGFQFTEPLRSEQLTHNNGAAYIGTKCKSNEDQRDLIAVSHSRQCVLANEFACHQTVCDVVKLLKNDAAKQRQAELPQHGTGFSDGQILIHEAPSFFLRGIIHLDSILCKMYS